MTKDTKDKIGKKLEKDIIRRKRKIIDGAEEIDTRANEIHKYTMEIVATCQNDEEINIEEATLQLNGACVYFYEAAMITIKECIDLYTIKHLIDN